jgi:hypothetical protein
MWRRRRQRVQELLELELSVAGDRPVRLDHYCPGAGRHRLLGLELTDADRARLREGGEVALVAACDSCIWERWVVLRAAAPEVEPGDG